MKLQEKRITTPLTANDVQNLHVGDLVLLSGILLTGRDAVLPLLVHAGNDGSYDGPSLTGAAVFHTAVSPAGVGPTSSNKKEIEESLVPLSRLGVRLHIGKGALGAETMQALAEEGAIFAVTPPVTALFDETIVGCGSVFHPELGIEAMYKLMVKDFPLIVAVSGGESLYD